MFKQLTHISLLLKPGDDSAVKMYLASRLHLSMDLASRQGEEIAKLKSELSSAVASNEAMEAEISHLRSDFFEEASFNNILMILFFLAVHFSTMKNVEVQGLQAEHAKELSQLQRQAMEAAEQQRARYEAHLEANRASAVAAQKDLTSRATALEKQLTEIQQEKGDLELKYRDAARALQTTELDRDRLLKECEELNSSLRQLTEDKSK